MPVHFRRATRAVWRHAHGSVFVLPSPGSDVVVLTSTGEDLWWLLAEPSSLEAAAHRLAEIYDVAAHEIRQDVSPVVEDLLARGVLERATPR